MASEHQDFSALIKKASQEVFNSMSFEKPLTSGEEAAIKKALGPQGEANKALRSLGESLSAGKIFDTDTSKSLLKLLGRDGWFERLGKEARASGLLDGAYFDADRYRIRHKQYAGLGKVAASAEERVAEDLKETIKPALELFKELSAKYEQGVEEFSKSPNDARYLNSFKHLYHNFLLDPQHGVIPVLSSLKLGDPSSAVEEAEEVRKESPKTAPVVSPESVDEDVRIFDQNIDSLISKGESLPDDSRAQFDKNMGAMSSDVWNKKVLAELESLGFSSSGEFDEQKFRNNLGGLDKKAADDEASLAKMKKEAEGCYKALQAALSLFAQDKELSAKALSSFHSAFKPAADAAQEAVQDPLFSSGTNDASPAKDILVVLDRVVKHLQSDKDKDLLEKEAQLIKDSFLQPWEKGWSRDLAELGLGADGRFDPKTYARSKKSSFRILAGLFSSEASSVAKEITKVIARVAAAQKALLEGSAVAPELSAKMEKITGAMQHALQHTLTAMESLRAQKNEVPLSSEEKVDVTRVDQEGFSDLLTSTGSYKKALYLAMRDGILNFPYKGKGAHDYLGDIFSPMDPLRSREDSKKLFDKGQDSLRKKGLKAWEETLHAVGPHLAVLDKLDRSADEELRNTIRAYREELAPGDNAWTGLIEELHLYAQDPKPFHMERAVGKIKRLANIYRHPEMLRAILKRDKEIKDREEESRGVRREGKNQYSKQVESARRGLNVIFRSLNTASRLVDDRIKSLRKAQAPLSEKTPKSAEGYAELEAKRLKAYADLEKNISVAVAQLDKMNGLRESLGHLLAALRDIMDLSSSDFAAYAQRTGLDRTELEKLLNETEILVSQHRVPKGSKLLEDNEWLVSYLKGTGVEEGHLKFMPNVSVKSLTPEVVTETEDAEAPSEEAQAPAEVAKEQEAAPATTTEEAPSAVEESAATAEEEVKKEEEAPASPPVSLEKLVLSRLDKYLSATDLGEKKESLGVTPDEVNEFNESAGDNILIHDSFMDPSKLGTVVDSLRESGFGSDGKFDETLFNRASASTKLAYRKASDWSVYYRLAYAADESLALSSAREDLSRQEAALNSAIKSLPEKASQLKKVFFGILKGLFSKKEPTPPVDPDTKPSEETSSIDGKVSLNDFRGGVAKVLTEVRDAVVSANLSQSQKLGAISEQLDALDALHETASANGSDDIKAHAKDVYDRAASRVQKIIEDIKKSGGTALPSSSLAKDLAGLQQAVPEEPVPAEKPAEEVQPAEKPAGETKEVSAPAKKLWVRGDSFPHLSKNIDKLMGKGLPDADKVTTLAKETSDLLKEWWEGRILVSNLKKPDKRAKVTQEVVQSLYEGLQGLLEKIPRTKDKWKLSKDTIEILLGLLKSSERFTREARTSWSEVASLFNKKPFKDALEALGALEEKQPEDPGAPEEDDLLSEFGKTASQEYKFDVYLPNCSKMSMPRGNETYYTSEVSLPYPQGDLQKKLWGPLGNVKKGDAYLDALNQYRKIYKAAYAAIQKTLEMGGYVTQSNGSSFKGEDKLHLAASVTLGPWNNPPHDISDTVKLVPHGQAPVDRYQEKLKKPQGPSVSGVTDKPLGEQLSLL